MERVLLCEKKSEISVYLNIQNTFLSISALKVFNILKVLTMNIQLEDVVWVPSGASKTQFKEIIPVYSQPTSFRN